MTGLKGSRLEVKPCVVSYRNLEPPMRAGTLRQRSRCKALPVEPRSRRSPYKPRGIKLAV